MLCMKKVFGTYFKKRKTIKWAIAIALFAALNILVKLFAFEICEVKGYSMYPTYRHGDYLLVSKCAYNVRLPRNIYEIPWIGILANYLTPDSIVDKTLKGVESFKYVGNFLPVQHNDILVFNVPIYLKECAVKRCIGLPGENISQYIVECESPYITPFEVVPYKGFEIKSSLLSDAERKALIDMPSFKYSEADSVFIACEDCFFVLGDNRAVSEDSRVWGVIPKSLIVGKVICKLF